MLWFSVSPSYPSLVSFFLPRAPLFLLPCVPLSSFLPYLVPSFFYPTMTALDDDSDYDDAEICALIASLNEESDDDAEIRSLIARLDLADGDHPPPRHPNPLPQRQNPPPRTPSPHLPPVTLQRHTFPTMHSRTFRPARAPVVYQVDTPSRREFTTDWYFFFCFNN